MKKLCILLSILLLLSTILAYQPRVVMGYNLTLENPYSVISPEISKTYYGELAGKPDYYMIVAKDPFELSVQIYSPFAPYQAKRFSFDVLNSSKQSFVVVREDSAGWSQSFEPITGEWYMAGPKYKASLPAGIYYVKVYNAENTGKYALVIGEKEETPILEVVNSLLLIPLIKQAFFGKNILANFIHIGGIVLAVGAVSVTLLSGAVLSPRKKTSPKAVGIYYGTRPLLIAGVIITIITWVIIYLQNTENLIGSVKSILIGILAILALGLVLLVNPKPDETTDKTNIKIHAPLVLLSFIGWWLLLLLTIITL